ncbi:MAG: hypothetical protein ACRD3W_13505, partial [Terriglobales bacterium]
SWLTDGHNLVAKLTTDDDGEGFDEVNAGVFIQNGLPVNVGQNGKAAFDCKFISDNKGEDPDCYHGPFLILAGRNPDGSKYSVFLGPEQAKVTGPGADGYFHLVFTGPGSISAMGVATTHHTVSVLVRNLSINGTVAIPDTHHHATNCQFGTNFCEDFDVKDYCGPGGCRE